jgi:thiamine-monophosphate kinase
MKMKARPCNEDAVLDLIIKELPPDSPDILAGIGDDCAVIRPSTGKGILQLLKTDALVEGVHYLPGTPLSDVGWKALCRPISDIAAMGGTPLHATITVAAPPSWGSTQWRSLYKGIGKAAKAYGVSIVGGETVRSPGGLFLSVALTGKVSSSNLRLRSTACPGDLLCVTGKLGGSFKSGRHLRFHPRLAEGQWLGVQRGVTAMMDLSDGLGSDLPRFSARSRCSFRLISESLPLHRGCSASDAITDGEDYELLLSITPRLWPSLQSRWEQAFPKIPLTVIGLMLPPTAASTPIPAGHDHLAFQEGNR